MGDSDDEYDRKRRDKFRGERGSGGGGGGGGDGYRSERRDDRRGGGGGGGRDDWNDRNNPFRGGGGGGGGGSGGGGGGGRGPRPDYYRGQRDRYGSPGREMPPAKRMRSDWGDDLRGPARYGAYDPYFMHVWNDHYAAHGLHAGAYGGHGPHMGGHPRGGGGESSAASGDTQTQPAMMTLKQFLDTQDDGISDSEVLNKYSAYKLEFKRQQLNEFFVAHKDEEWFKNKYHPAESVKRKEEQLGFLQKRVDVFNELLEGGQFKAITIDTQQTDPLIRLLDTVVIKLEGGTEEDLKILDEKPRDIIFPDRMNYERSYDNNKDRNFDKKNENDDDVIITSVEKKRDNNEDEPKLASPRPTPRVATRAGSDDEENWDDDDDAAAAPGAAAAPAAKANISNTSNWDDDDDIDASAKNTKSTEEDDKKKDKKALKRKRTNSDSSSSSSSDSDSSSSSSSDDDEDDEKIKDKYDLEKVKREEPEADADEETKVKEETAAAALEENPQPASPKATEEEENKEDAEIEMKSADTIAAEKQPENGFTTTSAEDVAEPQLKENITDKEAVYDDDDEEEGAAKEGNETVEKPSTAAEVEDATNDAVDAEKDGTEISTPTKDDTTIEAEDVDADAVAQPDQEATTTELDENKAASSAAESKDNAESKDTPADDQPETIDLDKEKDGPQPRALHRTSSIFLRNLAPSITKSEIEAVCQRFDGYLRVAIADPLVERRWYRRGWVTFKRDVNIKEICWNLNNTRLRDCEMGAIVNRDLSRRVRPVNGMTAHKTIVRADIKLCAKIAMNLDERMKLWDKSNTDSANATNGSATSTTAAATYGFQSNNPVLQNITDFLIEEASAEEEELLGISGDNKDGDGDSIERDPQLIAVLDNLILYLRIVHSVDFYNHCEYPYEDEMPNRCGIIHARGPPPSKVSQNDLQDYIKNFESKMQQFLSKTTTIETDELKNLGSKDAEAEVEKFIQANTQELSKDKWLCPLSGKKFKGPEFIRKHIFNKHVEKVDEVRKEVEFFNNYLKDPKRPQLPEHPGSTKRTNSESGGGYRPPVYPPAYAPPYAAYAPPLMLPGRGGRGFGGGGGGRRPGNEYRQLIQYRDLDAPPNDPVDMFN